MKRVIILSVLAISACSVGFLKYDSLPVVQATVKQGATSATVIEAGGPPEKSVELPKINGKCFNYTLRKDGSTMPFFVSFNVDGRVTNYGYVPCETAINEGYSMPAEPMKQRF